MERKQVEKSKIQTSRVVIITRKPKMGGVVTGIATHA